MRKQLMVTLTDVTGARHYSLSQLARRFIAGIVTLAVTCLFLGGVFIYLMYHALDDLEARRSQIAVEHGRLVADNVKLTRAVKERTSELKAARRSQTIPCWRLSVPRYVHSPHG